jgi:hypothetical protein
MASRTRNAENYPQKDANATIDQTAIIGLPGKQGGPVSKHPYAQIADDSSNEGIITNKANDI